MKYLLILFILLIPSISSSKSESLTNPKFVWSNLTPTQKVNYCLSMENALSQNEKHAFFKFYRNNGYGDNDGKKFSKDFCYCLEENATVKLDSNTVSVLCMYYYLGIFVQSKPF